MAQEYDPTQAHEAAYQPEAAYQSDAAQQHEAGHQAGQDQDGGDWLAGATIEIGQDHQAEQLTVAAADLPPMPEQSEHDQLA